MPESPPPLPDAEVDRIADDILAQGLDPANLAVERLR